MNELSINKTDNIRFESLRTWIKTNLEYVILGIVILAMIVIFSFLSPYFFKIFSLMNMIRRISVLSVLGIGMTFVLLSGGLDISIGSSIAFSGACAAAVMQSTGSVFLSMAAALIAGSFVGLINGFFISKMKLNPVVVTLAMMGIARTAALYVTDSTPISIDNESLKWLGQAYIGKGLNSVPVVIFFIIILYIIFTLVLNKTVFGKTVYAIGGNESAAKVSGIQVEKNMMLVYTLMGLMVGVGSIILIGRASAAIPWAGLGMEFDAITVVVLGGCALSGGEGSIKGTILGTLLYGILLTGLSVMEISPYYQTIVRGLLLLFSVLLNRKLKDQGKV